MAIGQGVHDMWLMHAWMERLAGLVHASASSQTVVFLTARLSSVYRASTAYDGLINRNKRESEIAVVLLSSTAMTQAAIYSVRGDLTEIAYPGAAACRMQQ